MECYEKLEYSIIFLNQNPSHSFSHNDIDLIIKHLTNELDALKQELDKCVNGNGPDYDGPQVFQKAIQSKLNMLLIQ